VNIAAAPNIGDTGDCLYFRGHIRPSAQGPADDLCGPRCLARQEHSRADQGLSGGCAK
jgi:hypothetical protein